MRPTWRLQVEGAVNAPLELNLADLRALPQHTIMATMECAGNGRSFLQPKVKGVEWDLGAVGNANWTGVLLRDVLDKAGVRDDALEVILEGADKGEIKEPPRPAGEIHYARSLPLAKARAGCLAGAGVERRTAHAEPRISVARGRAGLVRNGVGKMAGADHGQHDAVPRLLPVD